ncbi:MAG: bifunctional oligoribonuclease/PAP phosphatase NrnA [Actinomycetota bacterium]|nr:MAG: bifunctional oligoribonuclease/PAP phosphatase NrnA [Actinomycetota bacterium]
MTAAAEAWTVTPPQWAAVADRLLAAGRIVLLAHVSPDADALGSALAVGAALRRRGADVAVSFGDEPFAVPRTLQWLPCQEVLADPAAVCAAGPADVVVTFDVSSRERLGTLAGFAGSAGLLVAVDHHRSYTGFGEIHLVDTAAPATAALALQLLDRLGAQLDPSMATCLYAGLLTDTGSFRFAGTSAATHVLASRLLDLGAHHAEAARRLYDDAPLAAVRLLGAALQRAELDPAAAGGLGMVSTQVWRADRLAAGVGLDGVDPVVDALRSVHEAEVAVVLKQDDAGRWRVSLRSKGQVDVSVVAAGFGGGGHASAAGFVGPAGDPHAVLAAIAERLPRPVRHDGA